MSNQKSGPNIRFDSPHLLIGFLKIPIRRIGSLSRTEAEKLIGQALLPRRDGETINIENLAHSIAEQLAKTAGANFEQEYTSLLDLLIRCREAARPKRKKQAA